VLRIKAGICKSGQGLPSTAHNAFHGDVNVNSIDRHIYDPTPLKRHSTIYKI
jgi:hypothetical protein